MDFNQQQKILLEKQKAFTERLEAIKKDLQKSYNPDSSEQAQERENDEVLEALAASCEESLQLIKAALERFEKGEYGYCSQCGEMISEPRLNASPETTVCIDCAA